MAQFVDESTACNTKGQYMQTLGSCKVVLGCRETQPSFTFVGLYSSKGERIPVCPMLRYCITSMIMPDPWCRPALGCPPTARRAMPSAKRVMPSAKPSTKSWSSLPAEAGWIRVLVDVPAETALSVIPSMHDTKNWPVAEVDAASIVLYVYVQRPAMCPRHLRALGTVHRHSTNNAMLMCLADGKGAFRMLMRCFSPKCKHLCNGAWVELFEEDAARMPPK